MRTGESIIYILFAATGVFLSCVAAQARGVAMPNNPITMEGSNPVKFDHVLHRSLEIPCGECHHDNNHDPIRDEVIHAIADVKEFHCTNCHNKDFANTFLQKREDIFHFNCRTCHAVGVNGNRGPRKCNGCHIKKK